MATAVTLKESDGSEIYPVTDISLVNNGIHAVDIEATTPVPAVETAMIADGAVTSAKIDWTTFSCATIFAGDTFSLPSGSYTVVPLEPTKDTPGNGKSFIRGNFTYDSTNECITVGNGISLIEVGGELCVQNAGSGNSIWGVISVNDTSADSRIASVSSWSTGGNMSFAFAPVMVSVQPGDKIRLLAYTTASGASVRGATGQTYLTVKQLG